MVKCSKGRDEGEAEKDQRALPVRASVSRGQRVGMGRRRKAWSWCRTDKMGQQTPPGFQGHLYYQQSHSWSDQASPGGWPCWWHWCLAVFLTQRHPQRAYVHSFVRWGMEWAQVQAARFDHTILLGRTHTSRLGWVIGYFSQGGFIMLLLRTIKTSTEKEADGREDGGGESGRRYTLAQYT